MSAAVSHWLPRVTNHLIAALADEQEAHRAGDLIAAAEAAEDAKRLANLAWAAIRRARPARIATPAMREAGRPSDFTLCGRTRDADHPAFPPHRYWPTRP